MCGIFSAISFSSPFTDYQINSFKSAVRVAKHRGPDAVGVKLFCTLSNAAKDHFNIFLGHTRLSIIDLSDEGNQPMESDGIWIIYNGEIFNYLELREELLKLNVLFKTKSDTEVILKIYEKFGPSGFNKLNGMWAFILFDSKKKIVIVSRDRFSIKPLFFYRSDAIIFLASEIKQLLPLITPRDLNKKVMNSFLSQGLLDNTSETFFKNIERVEAKTNIIIDLKSGKMQTQKYYDYELPYFNRKKMSEKFAAILLDSIKIRLRSDVELGALLSGGLDSSAISIICRKIAGENFKTFTVISDDQNSSEEKYADIVTAHHRISNRKLLLNSLAIKENFEKVILSQDEPFAGFSMIAQYSILEKIKQETDITVVLSGQGGDEVLLGYLRYYFFYLRKLYKSKNYTILLKEVLASLIFRTVLMQWRISSAKRYLPGRVTEGKSFLVAQTDLESTWEHSSIMEAQKNDIDKYSIPVLTRYEDRNSMAHSLETRLPFLDHRLVEFLLGIEVEYKIRNGWNKYILRKSKIDLPKEIRWRRDKKGFTVPERAWLSVDFRDDILECFRSSFLQQAGIIIDSRFVDYYRSYLSKDSRIHDFDISRVYIAEKWMKKNFP
jgi:asparagine synthase (glutamine-hydrolysing)